MAGLRSRGSIDGDWLDVENTLYSHLAVGCGYMEPVIYVLEMDELSIVHKLKGH